MRQRTRQVLPQRVRESVPKVLIHKAKRSRLASLCVHPAHCQKGDLDQDRAMSLKNSLEARNMSEKPGTPDDENIQVLCPGSGATACESGVDEQELVNYYLTRRYNL